MSTLPHMRRSAAMKRPAPLAGDDPRDDTSAPDATHAERERESDGTAHETGLVEPERVLLHMPVDVRSVSLAVIAILASIFALQWAKAVFIPLLLGVMFSYALTPAVDVLQRWRLPRPLGAGLLLTAIIAACGWGIYSLSDDATALVETLPQVAQRLRESIQSRPQSTRSTFAKMQQAATEIAKAADDGPVAAAASGASATASAPPPLSVLRRVAPAAPSLAVTRVQLEKPALDIRDYVLSGTLGAATFLGQTAVVFFITFFLLASGDSFRRKMVKLAGPRLSQKRITIQALDEITGQIQRYLLVQLATSAVLGVAIWLAFLAIGLNHAAVWGVFAAVTNLIPYLGAIVLGGATAVVGFMQFGAIDMGLFVGAVSFGIHGLIGNLLTPWLTGRASRMSPFAVFVGVLAFGWLWGVWGLLLGVPILMAVKAVCDRIDDLKPIGEFLGA